mgnify:CR=1 FL=1
MEGLLRASGRRPAADKSSKVDAAKQTSCSSKQDEIWLDGPGTRTTCRMKYMDELKKALLVHPKIHPNRKLRIDFEGEELEGVAMLKARNATDSDVALAVQELQICGVLNEEYLQNKSGATDVCWHRTYAKVTVQELRDSSWARLEVRRLEVPELCFFEQQQSQGGVVWYIPP